MLQQILDPQMALSLRRAQIARREDAAEAAVSGTVPRIGEHIRRSVVESEARAGNDPHALDRRPVLAREDMRAHDAGERVAVGDPDPGKPQFGRPRDHLLRMRGPAQEGEVRHRRKLGEAGLNPDHRSLLPQAGEGGRAKPGRMRGSARLTMAVRIGPRSSPARSRAPSGCRGC